MPGAKAELGSHWEVEIIDSNDGSGDGIFHLPEDLMVKMGWREGDVLLVSWDKDGNINLSRRLA